MIEIKGSHVKAKAFMKARKVEVNLDIRALKKKDENVGYLDAGDYNKLERLESSLKVYTPSITLPVRCIGTHSEIIINGKTLQQFMKKLKGMAWEVFKHETCLRVKYGKIYGKWTGTLELHDLSQYFTDLVDIPVLEVSS